MCDDEFISEEENAEWHEKMRQKEAEDINKLFNIVSDKPQHSSQSAPHSGANQQFPLQHGQKSVVPYQSNYGFQYQPNTSMTLFPASHIPPCTQTIGSSINPHHQVSVTETVRENDYPYHLFPSVISNAIGFLERKFRLPPEIAGNVILSAAAIACQPLFEVAANENDIPEPCSLYLMTIIRSGGGKSLAYERIIKPFLSSYSEYKDLYSNRYDQYTARHELWLDDKKQLTKERRKAPRNSPERKSLEELAIQHQIEQPVPPKAIFNIFEDVTPAALKYGLAESVHAAILTDEGDVFLDGYAKGIFGDYNKLWDGASIEHRRGKEKPLAINTPLTINILVQNEIFDDYLQKNKRKAAGSGYLPRFLFSYNDDESNVIEEKSNDEVPENNSVQWLLETLAKLVYIQGDKYKKADTDEDSNDIFRKKLIILTEDASKILRHKIVEFNDKAKTGGKWVKIKTSVLKAREQILRLSCIMQCIHCASNEIKIDIPISIETIEHSSVIVEWYLDEAARLFSKNSKPEPTLENDAFTVFKWMLEKHKEYNNKFSKTVLQQRGATVRVRDKKTLDPALGILRDKGLIRGEYISYAANKRKFEFHYLSEVTIHQVRTSNYEDVLTWAKHLIEE